MYIWKRETGRFSKSICMTQNYLRSTGNLILFSTCTMDNLNNLAMVIYNAEIASQWIYILATEIVSQQISSEFSTCVYANFQFSWWSMDHFSAPFRAYICQMPGHKLSRLAKGTPLVSAFHRYHWFGVKLVSVGCAQDSQRV